MNRNLLLDTQLRSTMTAGEPKDEADTNVILPYHATRNFAETDNATPTFNPLYLLPPPQLSSRPNLQSGMSAYCIDMIA